MGGRAREHRRQFPAGCFSRSAVDGGCAIAHGYTNRNGDRDCSSQPNSYSHGYSDCGSEPNADSYSHNHTDTFSYAETPSIRSASAHTAASTLDPDSELVREKISERSQWAPDPSRPSTLARSRMRVSL